MLAKEEKDLFKKIVAQSLRQEIVDYPKLGFGGAEMARPNTAAPNDFVDDLMSYSRLGSPQDMTSLPWRTT
jgi:hypothetical protein